MQSLIVTNDGKSLMASILAEHGTVNFTKAKSSTHVITTSQIEELTELEEIKQTVDVTSVEKYSSTVIRITVDLPGKDVQTGYYIKAVGIYASDGINEILFAVGIEDNTVYVNPSTARVPTTAHYLFDVTVTSSDNINPIDDDEASGKQLRERLRKVGDYTPGRIYYTNDVVLYNDDLCLVNNKFTAGQNIDYSKVSIITRISHFDHYKVNLNNNNSNPTRENGYIEYSGGCEGFDEEDWIEWFGYRPCMLQNDIVLSYLDPENYDHTVNGENIDISTVGNNDVMVEFNRFGYKMIYDRYTLKGTIHLTNDPGDSSYSYYAFDRNGRSYEKFFIGAYPAYVENSKLYSLSGKVPALTDMDTARTYASNRSISYRLQNCYQLAMFQLMFVAQNGSINGKICDGISPSGTVTGGLNTVGMNQHYTPGAKRKYLGMESLGHWEHYDCSFVDSNGTLVISPDGVGRSDRAYYQPHGYIYSVTGGYMGGNISWNEKTGINPYSANGTNDTYFHCPVATRIYGNSLVQGGSNIFEQNFFNVSATNRLVCMI